MNYEKIIYKTIIYFLVFIGCSFSASASTLYMSPSEGSYGKGDSFVMDVRIDNVTECVNTVEAEILFPSDYLNVLEFLSGESVLSIWVEKPSSADLVKVNDEGKLYFAGGIPGGYCGRIPGDPGDSNLIAKLVFKIPSFMVSDTEREEIEIAFGDKTSALLNDGLGTSDTLEKRNAKFKISNDAVITDDDWKKLVTEDLIQPEPFVVELHSRPDIFDGRYYIIFSTVDKQSGVDHYEVLEIRPNEVIGIEPDQNFLNFLLGKKRKAPNWKVAEMPYVLEDQSLESIIKVMAIDKAGNSRQVEFVPPQDKSQSQKDYSRLTVIVISFVLIVIILITLVLVIIRKRRNVIK